MTILKVGTSYLKRLKLDHFTLSIGNPIKIMDCEKFISILEAKHIHNLLLFVIS